MTTDILDTLSYVNSSCLELLLQEIVPTSVRLSNKLNESSTTTTNNNSDKDVTSINLQLSTIPLDFPGTVNLLDSGLLDTDDVTLRVENHGYTLGLKVAEFLLYKSNNAANSHGAHKIVDILDIMKFVCRDVWKCLYNKQMDNLRTNHRGTFVLVDNSYKLIANLNSARGIQDTISKSKAYLWFPCGIIRGILMSFGVAANVTAEITGFPAVTFNIHTSINN